MSDTRWIWYARPSMSAMRRCARETGVGQRTFDSSPNGLGPASRLSSSKAEQRKWLETYGGDEASLALSGRRVGDALGEQRLEDADLGDEDGDGHSEKGRHLVVKAGGGEGKRVSAPPARTKARGRRGALLTADRADAASPSRGLSSPGRGRASAVEEVHGEGSTSVTR